MNILAFGAHPDDIETLMGGTIAKYAQKKHNVMMVVVTLPPEKEVRYKEVESAAKILNIDAKIMDLERYEMKFDRDLVEKFDGIIKDFAPDMVFTQWIHDSHQDHIAVTQGVIAASRKNKYSLYMYEQAIPSGMTPFGFNPNMFVDISNVIDIKIKSVLAHQSQLKNFTEEWIEGIKGRAKYWGYQINVDFAEAFEVVKEIRKIE
jgi:LmbE family N-acetylglucosaminyl deacetylase